MPMRVVLCQDNVRGGRVHLSSRVDAAGVDADALDGSLVDKEPSGVGMETRKVQRLHVVHIVHVAVVHGLLVRPKPAPTRKHEHERTGSNLAVLLFELVDVL